MKGVHGLVPVGVLGLGFLIGIYARGGLESVSEASPGDRNETSSGVSRDPVLPTGNMRETGAGGASCDSDDDCAADEICVEGTCTQVCQIDTDCADDDFCSLPTL